jgi:hypothetical protein
MNTYEFPGKITTVHDVAIELGRPRQSVLRWIKRLGLARRVLTQGKRQVATFIAVSDVPKIKELSDNWNKKVKASSDAKVKAAKAVIKKATTKKPVKRKPTPRKKKAVAA